jgi:hypothetical protein
MQDFLVRTLASLESNQVYMKEPDQVFTEKSCASLAWYDQSSCSWKTYQQSLVTDWESYSGTWPSWGMTAGGSAFAHPMSERRITEIGGSRFATPNTLDAANLRDQATNMHLWPTPNASDHRDRGNMSNPSIQRRKEIGKQLNLSMVVHPTSGMLNPTWVEWLMGFPIGFTVLRDWVTLSAHYKRQQRGNSLEVNK